MKNSSAQLREKEDKKTPIQKGNSTIRMVHFTIQGEGATNLIRNMWASDTPKNAVQACMNGFGMCKELAYKLCNGKFKLTGDTRDTVNNPDGVLTGMEDNTKEYCTIKLDTPTMVARLEKKFISTSESITVYKEGDYESDEFEYQLKLIHAQEEILKDVMEQLEFIYPEVGKTLMDLPLNKVRSFKQMRKEQEELSKTDEEREMEKRKKEYLSRPVGDLPILSSFTPKQEPIPAISDLYNQIDIDDIINDVDLTKETLEERVKRNNLKYLKKFQIEDRLKEIQEHINPKHDLEFHGDCAENQ